MQNRTVELMDGEEEEAEGEVPPPRRTRNGREVVRPHRGKWRMSKAERFRISEHLRFAYFLGKHVETSVTVVFE